MFTKHDPALRNVIPFGVDPYDAVGSFGVLVGSLVSILALVRAFHPYGGTTPSAARHLYLLRAQLAVVLVVGLTLVADVAALMHRPSAWVRAPPRAELLVLLIGMVALTGLVLTVILASARRGTATHGRRWALPGVVVLVFLIALTLYPERLIEQTTAHLFTILLADLLLFVELRLLLPTLLPDDGLPSPSHGKRGSRSGFYGWGGVALTGLLIGSLLFVGEMSEGGGQRPPTARLVLVASVFIGLATAGLLIAYAFVRAPLGLWQSD